MTWRHSRWVLATILILVVATPLPVLAINDDDSDSDDDGPPGTTIQVDCADGDSINEALGSTGEALTIEIKETGGSNAGNVNVSFEYR